MKEIKFFIFSLLFVSLTFGQEFKYPAGKAETVSIQNVHVDLMIEGYKGNDIIITTHNYTKSRSDARATGLKSAFNMEDNTGLGLKIDRDGNTIVITSSSRRLGMHQRLKYQLQVPDFLNLEILSKSKEFFQAGKVFVKNISKSLVFESNYEPLKFEDITGPASFSVESATIEGIFSKLNQKSDTYISSLYGLINITLPDNTPANLYLRNRYGEIYTDFKIELDKEKATSKNFSEGLIEGKLNGGGIRFQIKAESGNIYLRRKSGNSRSYIDEYIHKQIPKETPNAKIIAKIEKVGDDQDKKIEFQINKDQHVRIFAIGERGNDGGMADYGYIEDAVSKKIIWEMKESETRHAGGADKNRLIDANITLSPGKYNLCYTTDDSHSYEEWNSDPPDYDFWGIILFAIKDNSTGFQNSNEFKISPEILIKTHTKATARVDKVDRVDRVDSVESLDSIDVSLDKPDKEVNAGDEQIEQIHSDDEYINKIKEQLIKDKIINDENNHIIVLSKYDILIDGKRQSVEIFEKYKKLFETLSGKKLNQVVSFKFK